MAFQLGDDGAIIANRMSSMNAVTQTPTAALAPGKHLGCGHAAAQWARPASLRQCLSFTAQYDFTLATYVWRVVYGVAFHLVLLLDKSCCSCPS